MNNGEQIQKRSALPNIFGVWWITINSITKLLPIWDISSIKSFRDTINKSNTSPDQKIQTFKNYTWTSFQWAFPKFTGSKLDQVRWESASFLPNPSKKK
jgi:hypothetical protein